MLYTMPELPPKYTQVIEMIDDLRQRLKFVTSDNLNRWTGFLAHREMARMIYGSNTMEGVNATFDEAVAVVDGDDAIDPKDQDVQILSAHLDAMNYVISASKDPYFIHSEGTIKAIHHMMMKNEINKDPGRYRPGSIQVIQSGTNAVVYQGPDAASVPTLMAELIQSLNHKNGAHVLIRAAMAHLNLTMIHPFRDGNGRMARALQTLVLGREGILDPRFSSIEEYIHLTQSKYYEVLAVVGEGSWHPANSALPWIRYCLQAHYSQAQTFMRRMEELGALWGNLEAELQSRKLPARMMSALVKAAVGSPVRGPIYRKEAEVSVEIAKRDLKSLVQQGLLIPKGEKRGRSYVASDILTAMRDRVRRPRDNTDPFEERKPFFGDEG